MHGAIIRGQKVKPWANVTEFDLISIILILFLGKQNETILLFLRIEIDYLLQVLSNMLCGLQVIAMAEAMLIG